MIFFYNLDGTPIHVSPTQVAQNSGASKIYFAIPRNNHNLSVFVHVAFELPNGETLPLKVMKPMTLDSSSGLVGVQDEDKNKFYLWSLDLTSDITMYPGKATCQFIVSGGGKHLATMSNTIDIMPGVAIIEPSVPSTYEDLVDIVEIISQSKQNQLVAGGNVKLEDNKNGTTTITFVGGGEGSGGGLTADEQAKVDKLKINGTGDKFLADNGEYKKVNSAIDGELSYIDFSYIGNIANSPDTIGYEGQYISTSGIKFLDGTKYIKVPIVAGQTISCCPMLVVLSSSSNPCAFMKDDTIISKIALRDYENGSYNGYPCATLTIPDNVNYFAINVKLSSYDNDGKVIVEYGDKVTGMDLTISKINGVNIGASAAINSPLKGKSVALIGDSITENNYRAKTNWATRLKEDCGFTLTNRGISGRGFSTQNGFINRISEIPANVDIIGVAGSFNDLQTGLASEVGTEADTGTSTICGYINAFFDALITAFPTTPIVCYIQNPWGYYKCGIERSDSYVGELSKICAKKGIPFYGDMYIKGSVLKPWIEANRQVYFTADNDEYPDQMGVVDNVHPNSKGHEAIAKFLKGVFESNVL